MPIDKMLTGFARNVSHSPFFSFPKRKGRCLQHSKNFGQAHNGNCAETAFQSLLDRAGQGRVDRAGQDKKGWLQPWLIQRPVKFFSARLPAASGSVSCCMLAPMTQPSCKFIVNILMLLHNNSECNYSIH